MGKQTKILLFGSLRPDISRESVLEYSQTDILPVTDLLKQLAVAADRVQLVMVNHKAVSFDYGVLPGDRVALFPKEYMVFADWKDFRS
jgi:molybdopterin converting factor small subunit